MGDFIERMGGLFEAAFRDPAPEEKHYGVAVAEVVDNFDDAHQARVQLRLPWLPGYLPWARVAVPSAGDKRGVFFIPQVGDEVLVAFNQGDVREPFVIGSLWNGKDAPPADDAQAKRVVRTPAGHEIEFDDVFKSIVITSCGGQKVTLDDDGIVLDSGKGKVKLTLSAKGEVTLEAKSISLEATERATLKASSMKLESKFNIEVKAGGECAVIGQPVRLN